MVQKPAWTKLYKGEKGYAFEALSPEGDLVLLHAEENRANLQEVAEAPEFEKQEDFIGLNQFEIETVEIRVPNANEAQDFYSKIEKCWISDLYRSRGSRLAGRQCPNLGLDHAQSSGQSFRNRFACVLSLEGHEILYLSR